MSPTLPITGRKIRFALAGCGRISKNHFDSIRQHSDSAEIVDVCDVNSAALDKAIQDTGAKGHSNLSSMLAKTNADCVVLTTPSGIHPQQTVEVAKAGRHVLSEKPMATKWEDGVRMVRACEEAGVRLFVVKQNRKNATLQLLKQAVTQKRFGRIYMVTLNVFWQRPQAGYYDQAKWRGTWDLDGGAFMNQASHYVDLLEWLIGPIDSLHAYTATLARDIEAEDSGVLSVKWRNGALGSLNCTMLTYPQNLEGSITILGEKGTVRVGGVAVNEIQEWKFADVRPEDDQIKAASYETTSVYGFGHPLYYENVIKTLRGEAEPDVDGREGLKSLEVLIAAYRSSRDGMRVGLPLEL
ncbi:MviM Predicted dehydrogenases and related proteins [Comamonadaceae bacterium]